MKNLMKKITVLFVAVLMLFTNGTAHQVHAENEHNIGVNRSSNQEVLQIEGLDQGDKVELYKLYKANYSADGLTVNSYEFTSNGIVDGGKDVVIIAEQKYTEEDQTAGTIPSGKAVGDVKVEEVKVKIADLPKDDEGKINVTDANGVTVGSTTYKTGDANVDLTAAKALVGKYPFTVDGPTESQILAISAAIAGNRLTDVPKVDIYTTVGNTTDKQDYVLAGNQGRVNLNVFAKDVADASTNDGRLGIYDGTGIYLGRITAAEGKDTVYNPIIVSAGYAKENATDTHLTFVTEDLNVSGATYQYEVSKGTAKKSTPNVDKSVTGGFLESGKKPLLATESDGRTPYRYTYDASQLPDKCNWYIKAGKTEQYTAALAMPQTTAEEIAARNTALDALVTQNVEEAETVSGTDNIRSGALGSLFTYTITPTIPDYPENAVNKTLWFADRMGTGLDYVEGSLFVNLGTTKVAPTAFVAATHTEVPADVTPAYVYLHEGKVVAYAQEANNGFTINYIYDNLPTTVIPSGLTMTYQGVLNDEAFVGLPGNPNVATMIYSNNPDQGSTHKKLTKPEGNGNKEKEDEEIIYTYRLKFRKVDEAGQPLTTAKGAVFGLYAKTEIKDSDNNVLYTAGQLVHTIETGTDGNGVTVQVAPGTYYLQEIEAPDGYQLNNNKYDVQAVEWTSATKKFTATKESWEYTTTAPTKEGYTAQVGWLVGEGAAAEFYQSGDFSDTDWTFVEANHTLTHKTTGQVINNAWKAYIDPDTHVKSNTTSEVTTTREEKTGLGWVEYEPAIPNTKTPSLPATGGIGTYLFTIAGVAILALGAFMLIFRRREDSQH